LHPLITTAKYLNWTLEITAFIHDSMKQLLLAITLLASFTLAMRAEDEWDTVPLTGDDLKNILELNVHKHRIDFEKPGHATLVIKASGTDKTVSLPVSSKSATLMTYIERGPNSRGSSIKGLDTLHYWLSADGHSTYSYFTFETIKAVHTSYGKKDGVFSIVASASEEGKTDVGYSLRITSKP
jgi:hypothetical protein